MIKLLLALLPAIAFSHALVFLRAILSAKVLTKVGVSTTARTMVWATAGLIALPFLTPSAQAQTGSQPDSWSSGPTVRAVVIGISDYQDKDIPDLRFADRDAEAFANFLRSPAGGSLDNNHLQILINQNATLGNIAAALDWLLDASKEGDEVILYFSGHGDVERKTISQPGYLLCWDAPARVYLAGGALALPMFQDVISTLSVQNKAKVVVITDACHAGKLSGSQIGGPQATAASLAKQFANEVKILSCQPNEFSLEGEQWGGGYSATIWWTGCSAWPTKTATRQSRSPSLTATSKTM